MSQILKRETTEAMKIENLVRRLSVREVIAPKFPYSLADAILSFCAGDKTEQAEKILTENIQKKLNAPIIYVFPIVHHLLFEKFDSKHAEAVFEIGLGSSVDRQKMSPQESELFRLYERIIEFHRVNAHGNTKQSLTDLAKRERANFLREWLDSITIKEDLAKAVRCVLSARLGGTLDLRSVRGFLRGRVQVFDESLVEGYNIPFTADLILDNPVNDYYMSEAEEIEKSVSEVNRLSHKVNNIRNRKIILDRLWSYLSVGLGVLGLVPVVLFILQSLHFLSPATTTLELFSVLLTINLVFEKILHTKGLGTLVEYLFVRLPEHALKKKIEDFSDAGKRASMLFVD